MVAQQSREFADVDPRRPRVRYPLASPWLEALAQSLRRMAHDAHVYVRTRHSNPQVC